MRVRYPIFPDRMRSLWLLLRGRDVISHQPWGRSMRKSLKSGHCAIVPSSESAIIAFNMVFSQDSELSVTHLPANLSLRTKKVEIALMKIAQPTILLDASVLLTSN